jgi:NTE family protein
LRLDELLAGKGEISMDGIRNLVFEGGGVKGLAYIGALQALEENQVMLSQINRVGGTSAGAITALLLGLNYSLSAINDILWKMDFHQVEDKSFGFIRNTWRLLTNFGLCPGDYMQTWLCNIIAKQTGNPDVTFADIAHRAKKKGFRAMYFVATNLSKSYSDIFSYEHTPGMRLVDAVRASMSIPFVFSAVRLSRNADGQYFLNDDGDIFVDGGILNNYPVRLFDKLKYLDNKNHGKSIATYAHQLDCEPACIPDERIIFNKETLGFRLAPKDKIGLLRNHAMPTENSHRIKGLVSYLDALFKTLIDSQQDSAHISSDDWERTVYIDSLMLKATDFSLSDQQKYDLIRAGRQGVSQYFATLPQEVMV